MLRIASGLLLIVSAGLSVPVAAQSWPCPSGASGPHEVQIGTTGGSHGIGLVPVCSPSGAGEGGDGGAQPVGNPIDAETEATMLRLLAALQDTGEPPPAAADPALQALEQGRWQQLRFGKDPAPGEGCTALWSDRDGLVAITGPNRQFPGGLLTFWSVDAPRPADVATITVTMTQTNYPPQTVQALNYVLPGIDVGAIALTVPTIDAAIDTMLDVEAFTLRVDGRQVASIGWKDGQAARDRLRACVAGRG